MKPSPSSEAGFNCRSCPTVSFKFGDLLYQAMGTAGFAFSARSDENRIESSKRCEAGVLGVMALLPRQLCCRIDHRITWH